MEETDIKQNRLKKKESKAAIKNGFVGQMQQTAYVPSMDLGFRW